MPNHVRGVVAGVLLLFASLTARAAIPQFERDALVALYNSTGGSGWTKSTGWLGTAGTECSWHGVQCTDGDSTVVSIALEENNLTGTLPAQLAALTNLRGLDLWRNSIRGAIPSELGSLAHLVDLDLSYNGFTGTLPDSFAALTKLETMNASGNQLSGSLPSWLGSLVSLTELRLAENQFSAIPAEIGSMRNLRLLDLTTNKLSGAIPTALGSLANLERLELYDNTLSGSIPVELANLTSLTDLLLANNKLSGTIPPQLGSMPSLVNLVLSNNALTGAIPPELASLPRLELLEIIGNELDGSIPSALLRMPTLGSLNLSGNLLRGDIPADLNLPHLRTLWLGNNQLTGPIPRQLGASSELESLHLGDNGLTGTIPAELASLTNLQTLMLEGNQLKGTIPSWLGGMTRLAQLSLAENQLSGGIPSEIWSLTDLVELYLGGNELTGNLPAEIGNLTQLRYLSLDHNQLSGPLPTTIGKLTALNDLRLGANSFSGAPPPELWTLTSLEVLFIEDNALSGPLPPAIGVMRRLGKLSVAGNRFSGTLPAELGSLTSLTMLDVSSNAFQGEVPGQLMALTSLAKNESNFSFNALFTTDAAMKAFLDEKQGGEWDRTQTIAPTAVAIASATDRSAVVSWTPITYTDHEGGYQVTATPGSGGTTIVATTSSKSDTSILIRRLQASTTYSVVVQSVTHPHGDQQNLLTSDPTAPVSGTTTARVIAPADITLTAPSSGLVQIGGVPQNEDSFVLTNFGDMTSSITLAKREAFFTLDAASFTLAGGTSRSVVVRSVAGQAARSYHDEVNVSGDGVPDNLTVDIQLLSAVTPQGRAIAEAATTRIELVGASGENPIGTATFKNRGDATLEGILVADVPWLSFSHDRITIAPGASSAVQFTVLRSKRPDASASGTTVSGTLRLVYVDGSSVGAASFAPDATTPTPGLGVSTVTIVDTVKPSTSAGAFPALAPGEIVRFLTGLSNVVRTGEQFAADLSVTNTFGTRALDDLRMYFNAIGSTAPVVASLAALQPSQAVTVANVSRSVYGSAQQVGTLQIRTRDWSRLLVHARLLNRTAQGNAGTSMPVFRSDRAAAAGERIYLAGLRSGGGEHTNLYVQEARGSTASVQVEFLDASGTQVGQTVSPAALAAYGLTELANAVPAGAVTAIVTNSVQSAGSIIAYATVVDEQSGDTWMVVDWPRYYGFAQTESAKIPWVATSAPSTSGGRRRAVRGSAAATVRTDVTLFNPSAAAATVTLEYRDSGGSTARQSISLAAWQTRTIADAPRAILGSSASYGTLVVEPSRGDSVVASSRTWQKTAAGNIGTATPLLTLSSGLRVGQKQTFASVEDSAGASEKSGTRTGIGIVESAGEAVTVRASVLLSDGKSPYSVTISRDFKLKAKEMVFADSLSAAMTSSLGVTGLHDLQIEFEVVSGSGAATPFLLVTDAATGDTMVRLE